ncbi:MAG: low temperature requirement protein A [Bacteroidota bacterium]
MSTLKTHVRPMVGRDKDETHRAATPLELFFDLISVIAIAAAATELHHAIAEDHLGEGLIGFVLTFFGIWWAWMNFTWFASAYDTDDVPYRIAVMVMMVGALLFAAGVPVLFTGSTLLGLGGYIIMRLALVSLWLRAAKHDKDRRTTAMRYAIGITIVQIAWVVMFFTAPPELFMPLYFLLIGCELAVPVYAERAGSTTWHRHHIVERYGLLTIIVLGESFVALVAAVAATSDFSLQHTELSLWILAGLIIVFTMWWIYFSENDYAALNSMASGFLWGYGHFLVFAAVTAVGAGLAVGVDVITDHAAVGKGMAVAAVNVPLAIFILSVWMVHERYAANGFVQTMLMPLVAVLILVSSFLESGVLIAAVLMIVCLTLKLRYQSHRVMQVSAAG